MDEPLKLTVIMNSSVETIFAAKCCAIPDANLEIILTNTGTSAITVAGPFWLEGATGNHELHLFPQGNRAIAPGQGAAFYGSVDADSWSAWRSLTVANADGRSHRFELR